MPDPDDEVSATEEPGTGAAGTAMHRTREFIDLIDEPKPDLSPETMGEAWR
ncbi:hypothetical protein [Nocardiopsis composta]|uniref:Uncharacterized protein n=1 Tax=Nocardiopsis composta TaxID=157465 RepID=A0A7W8QN23_9ACTN|nr:hypothetical protein [Nocardiopsis composta]MBB5433294.1 hypothetical protein [Nocardiopsis composta]